MHESRPDGAALAVNVSAVRAFIEELPEDDEWPLFRWSGRFRCSLDEGQEREFGSLDDALAWAREHARHVAVELEDERYDASSEPLPADVLARAALGARRRRGEEWLDRTPEDPPIVWDVTLEISPPDLERDGPARMRQDEVAAAAGEALRGAGFDDVEMSAEGLDEGLADIEEQTRGHEGEAGWTTSHSLAYEVRAATFAGTRREVVERAVQIAADAIEREVGAGVWRHTTDQPVYLAWGVSADARPAGASPLGPPPL